MKKIFLLLVVILCYQFAMFSQTPLQITREMIDNIKKIKTLQYTLTLNERLWSGKMFKQESFFKVNVSPVMVYSKQSLPEVGLEVLYLAGANSGNALINPNKFPYVNLNLDTNGSLMRENQHHTIYQSGLLYVITILDALLKKYEKDAASYVKLSSKVTYDGVECYHILFTNPNYKLISYKVKKGETISSIANTLKLNDYMILDKNRNLSAYDDVSEGQTISIPVDYAKSMEIYIDIKRKIPLVIKVSDEKGLYEEYYYSKVTVNPNFSTKEFTPEFSGYGF